MLTHDVASLSSPLPIDSSFIRRVLNEDVEATGTFRLIAPADSFVIPSSPLRNLHLEKPFMSGFPSAKTLDDFFHNQAWQLVLKSENTKEPLIHKLVRAVEQNPDLLINFVIDNDIPTQYTTFAIAEDPTHANAYQITRTRLAQGTDFVRHQLVEKSSSFHRVAESRGRIGNYIGGAIGRFSPRFAMGIR